MFVIFSIRVIFLMKKLFFRFPLFAKSKDKLQFNYAVYLLNKNISQLRWYCGLPTADLRSTLHNLSGLINVKPSQRYLVVEF